MDLKYLRKLIDIIDTLILWFLRARQAVVKKVVEAKQKTGVTTYDPNREQTYLESLKRSGNRIGLSEQTVIKVFTAIMESSKDFQHKLRGEE